MNEAYICDAIRTPIGRYGGSLSSIRTDDLAALPLKALLERNPNVDWTMLDDVFMGCANQAGEDNRNVARMALLLAGYHHSIPGVTVNRLCGSGMDAIGIAARTIMSGEAHLLIAGGVESMSRSPFVMEKAAEAFSRSVQVYDTTIGWRFINKKMATLYGTDSMAQTAENIAAMMKIARENQDIFALHSHKKVLNAQLQNLFETEILPLAISHKSKNFFTISVDEHPRSTSLENLASLKPITHNHGTVTAGNASGINDGAAALLIASETAIKQHNLLPKARILGMAVAGVLPNIMGLGPVPATHKLLTRLGMRLDDIDIIELNEAFAAQALGCIRQLGLADDDHRINPQGGAIALGHPLGMTGARLVTTALYQLHRSKGKYALCTMCIGIGQGSAIVIEKV